MMHGQANIKFQSEFHSIVKFITENENKYIAQFSTSSLPLRICFFNSLLITLIWTLKIWHDVFTVIFSF